MLGLEKAEGSWLVLPVKVTLSGQLQGHGPQPAVLWPLQTGPLWLTGWSTQIPAHSPPRRWCRTEATHPSWTVHAGAVTPAQTRLRPITHSPNKTASPLMLKHCLPGDNILKFLIQSEGTSLILCYSGKTKGWVGSYLRNIRSITLWQKTPPLKFVVFTLVWTRGERGREGARMMDGVGVGRWDSIWALQVNRWQLGRHPERWTVLSNEGSHLLLPKPNPTSDQEPGEASSGWAVS